MALLAGLGTNAASAPTFVPGELKATLDFGDLTLVNDASITVFHIAPERKPILSRCGP